MGGFLLALALGDARILCHFFEELIPILTVSNVVMSIGSPLLPALLHLLSCLLHPSQGSRSIQKLSTWVQAVLDIHTPTLLAWTSGLAQGQRGRAAENAATGSKNPSGVGEPDALLASA